MTEAEKRYTIEKVFKTSGCSPNPETIDQMVKLAREVHFPAGAAIQEIGVEQKYLYLITEGIARSYYIDSEGNDITKMFIREEEFAVGESLFLPESLDVFEALENLKSLRFEAKKMKEIGKNVYKIVSLVGVGFVLTSFIVPEVIGVLAPSEYKSAIWATPPLLIGMFMYFIYCNFGNVEIYFHKQNAMLFSSVTVAVINIILDYILIQKYGYIAASYATMVSYYIYAGLHYMFMSRVCKEKKVENPFNASVIIVMTIVFSVLIMCPVLLYRVVLLRYSILAVICIICLVWAIKNRDFILQLISKKRV